ncbi:MAG: sensor histidine kinase [Lachnospiraceae bacterium]|nr:sensor histidine kinase [Lachnospiraceae bacterium]
MSVKKYFQDKWVFLFMALCWLFFMIGLLTAFRINCSLCVILVILFCMMLSAGFSWDIMRKKRFFDEMKHNLYHMDQKYLVLETLRQPSFYEGELFWQTLYECNKSMCEAVNDYKISVEDFKNYIEMWIHEVKLPIASLGLMLHNGESGLSTKYREQLRRMDQYTDQVLYYVRSEHTENDFLLQNTELQKIITKVALKYREDLLMHEVDFRMEQIEQKVLTDGKWLEFILGQIIWNSIKYRAAMDSYIRLSVEEDSEKVILNIYDNGIGIPAGDLKNVFKKSFTGENGRKYAKSTGMGLYIVKRLCDNLGHRVEIQSEQGKYTNIQIIFARNDHFFRGTP